MSFVVPVPPTLMMDFSGHFLCVSTESRHPCGWSVLVSIAPTLHSSLMMTNCMSYGTYSPRGLPTQVSVAPTFLSSHAVAPCVSLWYLGTHEAIPKLVQAGLATTEVVQVNIL